ncbi:MAG: hypothetical protein HQL56_12510, partial [Magnetococcales bacterium]|nr:hypothetical protein [Magnetococcales bacterium]
MAIEMKAFSAHSPFPAGSAEPARTLLAAAGDGPVSDAAPGAARQDPVLVVNHPQAGGTLAVDVPAGQSVHLDVAKDEIARMEIVDGQLIIQLVDGSQVVLRGLNLTALGETGLRSLISVAGGERVDVNTFLRSEAVRQDDAEVGGQDQADNNPNPQGPEAVYEGEANTVDLDAPPPGEAPPPQGLGAPLELITRDHDPLNPVQRLEMLTELTPTPTVTPVATLAPVVTAAPTPTAAPVSTQAPVVTQPPVPTPEPTTPPEPTQPPTTGGSTTITLPSTLTFDEGSGETLVARFSISRGDTVSGITVLNWSLSNAADLSVNRMDFGGSLPTSGTLTLAAGETSATLPFAIFGDIKREDFESFQLTFTLDATSANASKTYLSGSTTPFTSTTLTFTLQNDDNVNPSGSTTLGTSGADTLTGSAVDNAMLGLAGNDTLKGGTGSDLIFGGAGDDTLYGGDGLFSFTAIVNTNGAVDTSSVDQNDVIYGGDGNDVIYGESGMDILFGQAGNDTLHGYGGTTAHNREQVPLCGGGFLLGGDGNDTLCGTAGTDFLFGGDGN